MSCKSVLHPFLLPCNKILDGTFKQLVCQDVWHNGEIYSSTHAQVKRRGSVSAHTLVFVSYSLEEYSDVRVIDRSIKVIKF